MRRHPVPGHELLELVDGVLDAEVVGAGNLDVSSAVYVLGEPARLAG